MSDVVVATAADLQELLRSLGLLTHDAAELGVAEGRFGIGMLSWGFPRVYLVDAWATATKIPGDVSSPQKWHDENYATARQRAAPFGDRAVFLRGFTHEMAARVPDASLGFLYIDACHEYDWVRKDLEAWSPKVVDGGVIAGHDYEAYEGVRRAVHEFCAPRLYRVNVTSAGERDNAGFWFRKGKH